MSRVERTENPTERRGSEQLRQAERGRNAESRRDAQSRREAEPSNLSRNPSQAEGDESTVDEALKHGNR